MITWAERSEAEFLMHILRAKRDCLFRTEHSEAVMTQISYSKQNYQNQANTDEGAFSFFRLQRHAFIAG